MAQFNALMMKNWILIKRSPLGTCLQIFIPILFMIFVLMIRQLAQVENFDEQSYITNQAYAFTLYGDPASAVTNLGQTPPTMVLKQCEEGHIVALVPSGDSMVASMKTKLQAMNYTVNTYESDDKVDEIVRDLKYGTDFPYFCFGLSFENSGSNYKYNLRFNLSNNAQLNQAPLTDSDLTTDATINLQLYTRSIVSGFIGLSTMANNQIFRTAVGDTDDMIVNKISPIHQEKYTSDPIYQFLGNSAQFLILFPLLIVYLRQTSSMLEEKQKRIRQTMSIMGMKVWIYYLTWFLRYFITYLIIFLLTCAIFSGVFTYVPYSLVLVVCLLFGIVLIIQSFFVQIFVTKSKIGIIFALLFFILQYVISYTISSNPDVTTQIYRAISIVPHIAFILAFREFIYAQSLQIDITATELINQYTIATALVSFVLNILFWGILSIYLDQVFPNQFGAKKHPCFCFCGGCSKKNQNKVSSERDVGELGDNNSSFAKNKASSNSLKSKQPIQIDLHGKKKESKDADVESVEGKFKEMEENDKAIIIENLVKKFDDFTAVNNLNMKMYTDQIFVLLGHNGAGKTTTISMLTGMLQPTSGVMSVLGSTQVEEIRSKIGLCPQHDSVYDDLTVEEHVQLFAKFRGFSGNELDEEVNKLIKDVNLEEKRQEYSKNLSGGQRRRLSVALAFAGGSQVILLDEPTSGMDTSARRHIWEMLKSYRNDRIILLTTHFMDQADYLGDRIAIMAGGKLAALGSNVYLKNKFGVGYNISFVKKTTQTPNDPILNVVKKHVPDATILSSVSLQLTVQLPLDKVKQFPQMFIEIDGQKDKIGLVTYGISITTLQEVFLRVGQNGFEEEKSADLEQVDLKQVKNQEIKENSQGEDFDESGWIREDGMCEKLFSHLVATILKRIRVIKRDIKSFIFQFVLPMIIIILALLLMRVTFITDFPSQDLTYRKYLDQKSPVEIPISWASSNEGTLSSLKTIIESNYGGDFDVTRYHYDTDLDFDSNALFDRKKNDEKLKGGIYFSPSTASSTINIHSFTSIVNTKSPTSFITVQTLAAETLMNQAIGSGTASITVVNKPFPRTQSQYQINNTISGFFGALIFSIALSFKFTSIVSFIVKERVDKCKHQQIVSGLNLGSYWFGNFVFDYVLYAILAGFSIAMCVALDIESLIEGDSMGATVILFFMFGLANIPFTYLLAYAFKDYGNAQGVVYFINFVTGGLATIIILVLRWITTSSSEIGRGISWALRIIPSYSFGEGLINMGSINLLSITERAGKDPYKVYDLQLTLAPILYLVIFTIIYTVLVFVFEALQNNQSFMRCFSSENSITETKEINDEDVLQEQKKAIAADPEDYEILTKQLRKVYMLDSQKKHKVAVDNLSLGIKKGEVFGLLGVNGAGKTTTFKMLAGQIISTSGDSYFCGLKISDNLEQIRKNLGYCPQFDALVENLTVKEQLQLYYDMKCLPKKYKERSIQKKIKQMSLEEYEDKLSGTLSGGNKRKLSVAMAMIGNPSIIFLDEPSTGMDPKARRFMWKVISRISTQQKQSTVILTTHAMEEAEALSSRLGIMVSGNFKCIGTPQHIKSKYGKGFEIEVKTKVVKKDQIQEFKAEKKFGNAVTVASNQLEDALNAIGASKKTRDEISEKGAANYLWQQLKAKKECSLSSLIDFCIVQDKVDKIKQTLEKALGQIQIIEHFQTYVRFKTGAQVQVGRLFELLESKKENLHIMQYSIRQATVEQIFNKFAEEDENFQMD